MKRLRQLVSGGKMDGRGRNGTPSSSLPDTATIVVKMEGRSGRVVSATDCRVRGPRFESHRWRLCLSRQPLRYTALGTCTAVPRSTQLCIPPGPLNRVPASARVKTRISPLPGDS